MKHRFLLFLAALSATLGAGAQNYFELGGVTYEAFPGDTYATAVSYAQGDVGELRIPASVAYGRLGNRRASDRYDLDPVTGRITGFTPYADTAPAGKVRGWIYSLHVGSWGGTVTRLLSFVAALVGATLPLTGYYLWFRRLRARRRGMAV